MDTHMIKPENLEKIISYQTACEGKAPVTTKAVFRLDALQALIDFVKETAEYKEFEKIKNSGSMMYHYHICISFIREKIDEMTDVTRYTYVKDYPGQIKKIGKKNCDGYTQLIPIVTGCVCKLDKEYLVEGFEDLKKDGLIPFVAPGGEGGGLIPPPPKAK
jgi:hypothetical protein